MEQLMGEATEALGIGPMDIRMRKANFISREKKRCAE